MLKIEQLYYLTQVAKYNSINKAAESLYITKAAVSNSIKQLERQCGYPILERTYRGVRLTKNGERAVKIAEQVLSLCDEIERLGNEKVKKKEKYNLILTRGISKLLSKHLVGPSSKVLQYFKLEERYINLEDICERLSSHTIALVMVARKEIEIMKKKKNITCTELYCSKMYPVSSKHTKFIASDQKRITKEEFEKLPHVVMGRDDEKIGSNIVFQTENSKLYAEAILSDYGIGLLAKFAPDIFDVDYKLFKMYEPFHDEEMVITILSKGEEVQEMVDKLKLLIIGE